MDSTEEENTIHLFSKKQKLEYNYILCYKFQPIFNQFRYSCFYAAVPFSIKNDITTE